MTAELWGNVCAIALGETEYEMDPDVAVRLADLGLDPNAPEAMIAKARDLCASAVRDGQG